MQAFDILATTTPGASDPAVAIAACRAGAWGVLDLEYATSLVTSLEAISRLAEFTTTPYGIKLGRSSEPLVQSLLANLPQRLGRIILAGGQHDRLAGWTESFRSRGVQVL